MNYSSEFPCLRPQPKGFSLLEVLVSVAVLSIGLLGLAGLQTTGIRHNHSAYLRSQATLLAYDITDRMRANRTAALNGGYTLDLGTPPVTPAKNCNAATCEPGELAAYDLYSWFQNVTAVLPSGDSKIELNSGVVTVTLQWDEKWTQRHKPKKNDGDDDDGDDGNNNSPPPSFTKRIVMSTEL
ncbi:Type IV fimbrial biogenesis protein PilV [Nitrosococcus oceani ATCC 19707]|uniref:Type IV fimbrial biogenesis protein PilV n=2 Tax=Nitrosococcus oceani TaxID=1229 RepID=Q3J8W7_NITOC|nr:type IV pilus modification protein PilV [Nitrosococcus oceani]ABA58729.1 Type IV fimbrial biogenesis protein PilV [Nitrosococcus oceani ATCC 19707]EDZ68055.1 type IV pilus modification protein PilV, putative [Nitrosococcus oceani AFC27]KFI18808.1 pilus assembly protein PilV [Nitrosococcus oceani C-27]GEM19179.1 type IV pilus modification protein PilV [Nitrosococcus oceani]